LAVAVSAPAAGSNVTAKVHDALLPSAWLEQLLALNAETANSLEPPMQVAVIASAPDAEPPRLVTVYQAAAWPAVSTPV
jgi:hypothetical protein